MMHRHAFARPGLLALVAVWLLALACPATAQELDSAKFFDDATRQVAEMRARVVAEEYDAATLMAFRDKAGEIAGTADALIADRTPRLETLNARIAELGEAPAKGAPAEPADIAAQRSAFGKTRTTLETEIKRAKLIVSDGQQLGGEVAEARRSLFQRELFQRTASPLTPAFWNDALQGVDRDSARLAALRDGASTSLAAAFEEGRRTASWIGLLVGVLLLVFGRWGAELAWLRATSDRMPHGRLRRSALAFAVIIISAVLPGTGVHAIYLGLNWHDVFVEPFASLASVFVNAVYFGGAITGLGRALLSPGRPTWRLVPVADAVALRLRHFPALFATVVVVGFMLNRTNSVIGTSLSATIAATFVVAVLYAIAAAWVLVRLRGALARQDEAGGDASQLKPPAWIALARTLASLAVLTSFGCALTGYVALAAFLINQVIWISLLAGIYYITVTLVEDICATWLSSRAKWTQGATGLSSNTIDQISVVLAGAFRLLALLFVIVSILAPFGAGPGELLHRGSRLGAGIRIGEIHITPSAVFSAIVVFLVGLFLIGLAKRWLSDRYLPTTRIEEGMRSSITTLLGYAGGVVVFALALSALGLSLERIGWVASALSVGIGFGLQAIVQNFISGLILLIERPVKVGDWVALGTLEGDIRRINVRATEIQMGDRSTVIVPNSEFITKTVRNVTLSNAEGRVRIVLPLPLETDARAVRQLIRDALAAQPAVLANPEPSVLLDNIESGSLMFIVTAYIISPRNAGGIRSELLLDILARLQDAGVALSTPQEIRVSDGHPRSATPAPLEASPALPATPAD